MARGITDMTKCKDGCLMFPKLKRHKSDCVQ